MLVAGASGLIGRAVVDRLLAAGHRVIPAARDVGACRDLWPFLACRPLDYTRERSSAQWRETVAGADVVVNAVGIFAETGKQRFDALHVNGPARLFAAAVEAGALRVIQISALGADAGSPVPFLASKGRADDALARLPIAACVLRPSLVFAPSGASTRAFARLAALPVTPLPGSGRQPVQPVHVDDVADAVLRLAEGAPAPGVVDAVGAEVLSFRDYLAGFRRAMGLPPRFLRVPRALVRAALALSRWSGGWAGADASALEMLDAGSTADGGAFAAVLGRPPWPVDSFLRRREGRELATQASLGWLVPLLRLSVAALWIGTAVVSWFFYPLASSLALLARTGLHGASAEIAFAAAVALDLVLGVATVVMRRRAWLYRVQVAVILVYTVVISFHLPEFWRHPYGPVLKNVPLLAALLLLCRLDRGR